MKSQAATKQLPEIAPVRAAHPAIITLVEGPRHVAVARAAQRARPARVAVAGAYAPSVGDEVLVVPGEDDALYVIGVLSAVRAEVDATTHLLVEHDAGAGRTVVRAPHGDLELRAEGAVRLATAASTLELGPRGLQVAAPRVEVTAQSAEVAVDEGRFVARHLASTLGSLLQVVGVVETRADRIVERAKEVYTEVEEMAQTHAKRVRIVARETFHLLGKRTRLKAELDMKLKGKTIHLD